VFELPDAIVVPTLFSTKYEYGPEYPDVEIVIVPFESLKQVTGVAVVAVTSIVSNGKISNGAVSIEQPVTLSVISKV
jgi:hypothetical protein